MLKFTNMDLPDERLNIVVNRNTSEASLYILFSYVSTLARTLGEIVRVSWLGGHEEEAWVELEYAEEGLFMCSNLSNSKMRNYNTALSWFLDMREVEDEFDV